MNDTVSKIIQLHQAMEPLLKVAGLANKLPIPGFELPGTEVEEAWIWMLELKDGAYKQAKRLRDMQSEERWARYEVFIDLKENREYVLWVEAVENLKLAIKNRPGYFRKNSWPALRAAVRKAKRESKAS